MQEKQNNFCIFEIMAIYGWRAEQIFPLSLYDGMMLTAELSPMTFTLASLQRAKTVVYKDFQSHVDLQGPRYK